MFSPSDYNDAVPQFTNGNYANTPLNPLYVEEPDAVNYNRGSEPLQTLPAQWWNWLCNKITSKLNKLNIYVKNIFDELAQLLSLVGVTPDATEEEPTIGQLKGMFQTNYPQYLNDNFKFESVLQGRTRGVMVAPTDSWDNNTNTLSLTGGFGIIDAYHKVVFANCDLILSNDGNVHYIVSDANGVISIESSLADDVILVGLCHDKEYCLLTDIDPNQCKDNIILKKWFGQNKISTDFVSILKTYYNTLTETLTTNVLIHEVIANGYGITALKLNNSTITIETVNYNGTGIGNGTYNNCVMFSNTATKFVSGGTYNKCTFEVNTSKDECIRGGHFYHCKFVVRQTDQYCQAINGGDYKFCNIEIGTANGAGVSSGELDNCTIYIDTVKDVGIDGGIFRNSYIYIKTVNTGAMGIYNGSVVKLYLTKISCSATTNLSSTGGKLNVLNEAVLHTS